MSREFEGDEYVPSEMEISRRKVIATTGGLSIAGLAGCSGGGDGESTSTSTESEGGGSAQAFSDISIAYIPHASGASDSFWGIQERGWSSSAKQLGVDAQFNGPSKFNPQKQVQNINSALSAGVDGIATSISDPELFKEPLNRAANEGIPVLTVNITQFGEKTLPYQGYVGQAETRVGNVVANKAIEKFKKKQGEKPSRAVIPNHQPGNYVLSLRKQGIVDVMKKNNIPIDEISTSDSPSKNISALQSYRQSNQNLDLVLALGPTASVPALTWLKENDLQGKVFITGVDITPKVQKGIKNGNVFGTVIQQPYLQGYLAAQYLSQKLVNGVIPPTVTPTGPTWIDQSNLSLVNKQINQVGGA